MRRFFLLLVFLGITFVIPAQAGRDEFDTDLKITVRAKDAKFIGTSMGGAHVIIRHKLTGDVLAEGLTYGGTGNTGLIMADEHKRDAVIFDDSAASYETTIAMLEPTPVTIAVTAPMAQPQSQITVTTDMILLPGKDYMSGNGIMIEMPGMAVDVLAPAAHEHIVADPDKPVLIAANIVKLCGCPIGQNDLWPVDRYEVDAYVYQGTRLVLKTPLKNTSKPSHFAINVQISEPGPYRVVVTAFDPKTKESGVDYTTFIISK